MTEPQIHLTVLQLMLRPQASGNKITTLEDLAPQLADKESLETVYLEHNPVQRTEGAAYRRKIILSLPQLKQIVAT